MFYQQQDKKEDDENNQNVYDLLIVKNPNQNGESFNFC